MKNIKQNPVLFMAQAAMVAAIYVVLTLLGRIFQLRRSSGPYFRGTDHSSGIYPCCNPRIIHRAVFSAIFWADASCRILSSEALPH